MFGLSKKWLFGIGTAVAVAVIAFLAWRTLEIGGRTATPPGTSGPAPTAMNIDSAPARGGPSPAATPAPAAVPEGKADGKSDGKSATTFDVVRVEPSGDTVIAGRGAPDTSIRLLDRGNVIAETRSDANGQFAMVPPALGKGEHLLSLQSGAQAPGATDQSVAVAIPSDGKGDVVVALAEPGAATRILSETKPAPPPAIARSLAIRTVEAEDTGGFYATGSAMPGATVQLYLNDAVVATVQAGENGAWSLKIARGMAPGAYAVRADQVGSDGKVISRAEVPFDYPAGRRMASTDPAAPVAGAKGPDAVVADLQTVTVLRGDSLWRISRKMLGSGMRYTQIYTANNQQIRNPSLIYPKQILVLPAAPN
ncbi:MAG: LysM peptidoglycan-binding domain-containing protein [Beijerinckiaceae bacterium]|jgi:LysM repeat protein|nr:LysM peptidoglycan-binding domain-containing protein [Beijerinckiaceae bacterium]